MAYFPKQSINYRNSSEGEFVFRTNNNPYEGSLMETSTGRFYAGNDPMNLSKELIKKKELNPVQFGYNSNVKLFNSLKSNTFNKQKKFKTPTSSRIGPSEKDYKRGYYTRYYMFRTNNEEQIYEISKKTFQDTIDKKVKFDKNLYKVGSIIWALKGEVASINFLTLEETSQITPNIKIVFPKLDEFFKKPKPKKGDEYLHNILGRYYPNDDSNPIPSNLPPTYRVGIKNKKCKNCIFLEKNICGKWKANVKQSYWCKSYHPNQDYLDANFQEFLDDKKRKDEDELRMRREGKLLTGLGKALGEALKERGITDIEGADIENYDEGPDRDFGATPEKRFSPVSRKSRRGVDIDPRREESIYKKLLKQKQKEINFDPTQIKRDASGQQQLETSGLPPGRSIGEVLFNTFDKKYYKWDGKQWK